MNKKLKIGNVSLENPVVLAPMAGVTDLPFRLLCKEYGAGLLCMEMVSAKAIYYNNKNTELLMEIHPEEKPVSLQLFGSDPDIISEMAKKIEEKPFDILEVKARIKAIMRRTSPERAPQVQSSVIEKGDIKLDCDSRRLFINDNEINLTAREFELLEILIKNENKVYSRESLLKIVWGEDYPGDVRTVDVHVRRLREKIEANPSEPKYVHTKWGVGYYYNQK